MAGEAEIEGKLYEDMISELSDDLLVHILSLVPTKDAVRTMFLSKRWRFVWTMIPKLEYASGKTKSNFLNKSMQLHRAPLLESLCILLFDDYPIDADVRNWVTYAVERCVRELYLSFFPQWQNLPTCLYSCKTLVKLTLSSNVLVDVPSQPSLPSLGTLILRCAAYKNQDSFVKLLSSCPVLKHLHVIRTCSKDNMISFTVKVPSLETFEYMSFISTEGSSLFIDSPGLKHIDICAFRNHNCSVQNMPGLDVAILHHLASIQNAKFLTSFSSVRFLQLNLTKVVYCNAIKFSRLIGLNIYIPDGSVSYSLDALMLLLHNAPKLKVLMIHALYF